MSTVCWCGHPECRVVRHEQAQCVEACPVCLRARALAAEADAAALRQGLLHMVSCHRCADGEWSDCEDGGRQASDALNGSAGRALLEELKELRATPIGFKTELLEEENDRLRAELAAVVERCAVAGENAALLEARRLYGQPTEHFRGLIVKEVGAAIRAAGRGNG